LERALTVEDGCQERLEAAFTAVTDGEMIRGVSEGILLADDLVENTPLLRTAVGRDLRGHIRRAGVMFRLRDLSTRGDLPYIADIVPMPYGNWHWLEIKSGNFKAHVCRSIGPFEFPEETLSRQDARLANQFDLFGGKVVPISEALAKITELYAWLTFAPTRDGGLQHLCWAMPPADEGTWLAHIDIMDRAAKSGTTPADGKPPEPPATEIKLRFKEHIEETLVEKNKTDKKNT
jgi:hypothetical protein